LAQANENIERLQALMKREPYASDSALVDTVKATAKALEAARIMCSVKKKPKAISNSRRYGRANGAALCGSS